MASLRANAATFAAQLDQGDTEGAAAVLADGLTPAALRVHEALETLVAFNTAAQRRLAAEIPQVRRHAGDSEKRLVGVFALSGAALMVMVVTGVRRYERLLDEQRRVAEEKSATLSALGARLESLNGVIVRIARSIFRTGRLETVLGIIAEEARAIMRADQCIIDYRPNAGNPIEVRSSAPDDTANGDSGAAASGAFLKVSIVRFEQQVGSLFLARQPGQAPFSETDERLLGFFTAYVGAAIDNARLYAQAQSAVQMREDLLAFVAHDLRNPISAILGASELLTPSPVDRTAQLGTLIQKSASRMLHLADELLEAAKLEGGQVHTDPHVHPLQPLVDEVVELLGGLAAEKSIQLVSGAPEVPIDVTCDRSQIVRVLTNLIGNAIKFTPRGGTVTVTVARRESEAQVSISDSGPGIDPAMVPRLFDRFWQAHNGKQSGAGLGLYISKIFVEANHGRIGVESPTGQGAHFHFTLPAVPAAAAG